MAFERCRTTLGETNHKTIAYIAELGPTLLPQGRLAESLEAMRRVLPIREQVYATKWWHPANHYLDAWAEQGDLCMALQGLGRHEEAVACFEKRLQLFAPMIDVLDAEVKRLYWTLGDTYTKL